MEAGICRPHRNRVFMVDSAMIKSWATILEQKHSPPHESRMVYAVNRAAAQALDLIGRAPRIADEGWEFATGSPERAAVQRGVIEPRWGAPSSWDDVWLQESHFYVATPFFKAPNESMRHSTDWFEVDIEAVGDADVPVTAYKPGSDRPLYNAFTAWWNHGGQASREAFRVVWRKMVDNSGKRTLVASIAPPGANQGDSVSSMGGRRAFQLGPRGARWHARIAAARFRYPRGTKE